MNSLKLALVAIVVLVSFPPQAEGADLNTAMTVRVYENFDDGYSYKPLSLAAAVYMGADTGRGLSKRTMMLRIHGRYRLPITTSRHFEQRNRASTMARHTRFA